MAARKRPEATLGRTLLQELRTASARVRRGAANSGLSRAGSAAVARLHRLAGEHAKPGWVLAFRASYATFGLLYAIDCIQFQSLLWPHAGWHFWLLMALWLGGLAALTLGIGGWLAAALHYLGVTRLLSLTPVSETVEDWLYVTLAFWLIFLPTQRAGSLLALLRGGANRPTAKPIPAWPVYLMGVSFSVSMFTAAISKFYDPMWRHGLGLYYTLYLPWIKVDAAHEMLAFESLVVGLNHVAIAFEFVVLPLFLFPRTRLLALLLLSAFFVQLTFPFQLGYIGPFGLVMCVLLGSITRADPIVGLWRRGEGSRRSAGVRPASAGGPPQGVFLPLLLAGMVLFFSIGTLVWNSERLAYPLLTPPLGLLTGDGKMAPVSAASRPSASRLARRYRQLDKQLNLKTTRIKFMRLFNSQHSWGIYSYRVSAELEDGTTLVPMAPFEEDRTPGPDSRGLQPRFAQAVMYSFAHVAHARARDPLYEPPARHWNRFEAVVRLALERTRALGHEDVRRILVRISPILMPESFDGASRRWLDAPWTTFLEYDVAQEKLRILEVPELFPLHFEIPDMPGYSVGVVR